jgi:Tol biopolymer transport system component
MEPLGKKSLVDGREAPLLVDDYQRWYQQWSPDGARLAYARIESGKEHQSRYVIWSSQSREEAPLTALSMAPKGVDDWPPDGKSILVAQNLQRNDIWLLTVADAPHAEISARKIVSDPAYDLFQSRFSPDGRWIVFEAFRVCATAVF